MYCGTCMKNSLHPHGFHYVIIATVDLYKPVKITDGHFQARVKVQELFPHDCGCTTPTYLQEYSRVVDSGAGGSGYDLILDFPQEEIMRDTFDPVLLKLKNIPVDGDHHGYKINNDTGVSKACHYPYDNHFYFKLSPPTEEHILFFDLSETFNKKFNHLFLRLQLYVAKKHDSTKQFFGKL